MSLHHFQCCSCTLSYLNQHPVFRFDEALGGSMIEKGEKAVVISLCVDEDAGFLVDFELRPGDDLNELVEGAVASGKRDEGVGVLIHEGFALVHGLDDVEMRDSAMRDFAIHEHVGHDADDFRASREGGIGEDAHEANGGSAKDKAHACFGYALAQFFCGLCVFGIGAVGRSAEDANAGEVWFGHRG